MPFFSKIFLGANAKISPNLIPVKAAILKKLLLEKEFGNSNIEGDVYYHLGVSYYRSGEGKSAIENFIKAIPFY